LRQTGGDSSVQFLNRYLRTPQSLQPSQTVSDVLVHAVPVRVPIEHALQSVHSRSENAVGAALSYSTAEQVVCIVVVVAVMVVVVFVSVV
jgi:hypothetical protein